MSTLGRWCSPLSLRTDYLEAVVAILGVRWGSAVYPPYSGLKDLELPWPVLVRKMRLFLCLEGLWALPVPRRVGSAAVNTLLRSMEFRTVGLSLGVRRSCAVATPGRVLAIPADMAKLVASEAPADSKVGGVGLTVKDLGLPD